MTRHIKSQMPFGYGLAMRGVSPSNVLSMSRNAHSAPPGAMAPGAEVRGLSSGKMRSTNAGNVTKELIRADTSGLMSGPKVPGEPKKRKGEASRGLKSSTSIDSYADIDFDSGEIPAQYFRLRGGDGIGTKKEVKQVNKAEKVV